MDLIVVVLLITIILIWKRDFIKFVYFLGIIELFFKIVHFIGDNLGLNELNNIVNTYIPTSIFSLLAKYSNGLFYTILCWLLIICFICLEFNLIKYWFKKK